MPATLDALSTIVCSSATNSVIGTSRSPIPTNRTSRCRYMRAGRRHDLAPGSPMRGIERRRRAPRRAREPEQRQRDESGEDPEHRRRPVHQSAQDVGAAGDGATEEAGRRVAEHAARGNRVAPVTPAVGPLDRLRPLALEVRTGRAVVERALELAPTPLEADPGKRSARGGRLARDRLHDRSHIERRPSRVVAADTLRGGAAEIERLVVEVRVRTRGYMDDWVPAVDELELVALPAGPFSPFVLAVADLDGFAG